MLEIRERIRMCEECGSGDAYVMDTLGETIGTIPVIKRRIACRDCSARFYTYEINRPLFNELQSAKGEPLHRGTNWEKRRKKA